MELVSIRGDDVFLLFHPGEREASVGDQFLVREPAGDRGLVVQVISNDSLDYPGLQQEIIQRTLEERVGGGPIIAFDREPGMQDIGNLKIAKGKIRKLVRDNLWERWDGWIPSRSIAIESVSPKELLSYVTPATDYPLSFSSLADQAVNLPANRLNMVNVITGVKGSGKSHVAKHVLLGLAGFKVPCIVYDINGEYVQMPNAQVLRWGENFTPSLADVDFQMLAMVVDAIYPLPETSRNVFEGRGPGLFRQRRTFLETRHQPFTIDLEFLRGQTWDRNDLVQQAIVSRLALIDELGLFQRTGAAGQTFGSYYDSACRGAPIIFDMRESAHAMQTALVRAVNKLLEDVCNTEANTQVGGQGRFPFVFYEEAHFYSSRQAILNTITRGRHIGMGSVFITNTPDELPEPVFRQLDNLFLLALTHRDDIKHVSKSSLTDEETVANFATRMPDRHALLIGNITDRYPLLVSVHDLPEGVPPSGQTRSTWDRFVGQPPAARGQDGG